jgi:excisionase family DNA binding protein
LPLANPALKVLTLTRHSWSEDDRENGWAPDDLMMAADVGRILRISVDMVRLLARDGRLPFISTVGGVRLFRRAEVDALALRRQAPSLARSGSKP